MTKEETDRNDDVPEYQDDEDCLVFRDYFDADYFDGADEIDQLGYLACRGSRSAAVYLRRYYSSEGTDDPRMAYKYACYAALAGDEESREILRSEGRLVRTFFLEDYEPESMMLFKPDASRPCEDREYLVLCPVLPLREHVRRDPELNVGYIHPDDFGLYRIADVDFLRPEDLDGEDRCPYGRYIFSVRHWPSYCEMDRWLTGEHYNDEDDDEIFWFDEIDERFFRDIFQYYGIGIERDEDAAIRDLLDMARQGNRNAADMISFAIGYEPETFLARYSDHSEETLAEIVEKYEEYPRRGYYAVADGGMLQKAPEWIILSMLIRIDPYGFCYDKEHENSEGGYEDDVMYTRADDQFNPGPPTFVFKPSGYSMGWYKYCWKSAEQSENLSMGEIRRVMRLCIEHLAYGREIPNGPTKELIAAPMHLYEPPEDIRDELFEIARNALSNLVGIAYSGYESTFHRLDAEPAEELALEIIADLTEGRP